MDRAGEGKAGRVIVVLGHFPEYLERAALLDRAVVFNVPTDEWALMNDRQRWDANRAFLDEAIGADAEIILATPPALIRFPSYLASELEYLIARGYRLVRDGADWKVLRA